MMSCRMLFSDYRKIMSLRNGMALLFHLLEYDIDGLERQSIHNAIEHYSIQYIKSLLKADGTFDPLAYAPEIMRTIAKLVRYLPNNEEGRKLMEYARAMRTIAHARDISKILKTRMVEFQGQVDISTPLSQENLVVVELDKYPNADETPHFGVVKRIRSGSHSRFRIYYLDNCNDENHYTFSNLTQLRSAIKNVIGVVPPDTLSNQEFRRKTEEHYRKFPDSGFDQCRNNLIGEIKTLEGFRQCNVVMRHLTNQEITDALHAYSAEYATLPSNLNSSSELATWLFERVNAPSVVQLDDNIANVVQLVMTEFKPLELRIGLSHQKIDFSECDICMEVKTNIITLCPNKHLMCADCWERVDKCPFCRSPI
jgi:hypothetical protein